MPVWDYNREHRTLWASLCLIELFFPTLWVVPSVLSGEIHLRLQSLVSAHSQISYADTLSLHVLSLKAFHSFLTSIGSKHLPISTTWTFRTQPNVTMTLYKCTPWPDAPNCLWRECIIDPNALPIKKQKYQKTNRMILFFSQHSDLLSCFCWGNCCRVSALARFIIVMQLVAQ